MYASKLQNSPNKIKYIVFKFAKRAIVIPTIPGKYHKGNFATPSVSTSVNSVFLSCLCAKYISF